MSVTEAMEVAQAGDIVQLRNENAQLREALHEAVAMRNRTEARLADVEEKCQELSEKLVQAEDRERWLRNEYNMLAAQMEVVTMIFGGNRGRDCCGCH